MCFLCDLWQLLSESQCQVQSQSQSQFLTLLTSAIFASTPRSVQQTPQWKVFELTHYAIEIESSLMDSCECDCRGAECTESMHQRDVGDGGGAT
ncbi:GD13045 [Drosophila simulans]|uniref:GD13045 n=1 Tax=Drosophila simulans TaxID=7240 RepID=B4QKV9_DROSI|nr:GD13045 [Drosophila simulans]